MLGARLEEQVFVRESCDGVCNLTVYRWLAVAINQFTGDVGTYKRRVHTKLMFCKNSKQWKLTIKTVVQANT